MTAPTGSSRPATASSPSAIAATRRLIEQQPVEQRRRQATRARGGQVFGIGR
jgi:hypothetical protein